MFLGLVFVSSQKDYLGSVERDVGATALVLKEANLPVPGRRIEPVNCQTISGKTIRPANENLVDGAGILLPPQRDDR
jgi:hypothetical protein